MSPWRTADESSLGSRSAAPACWGCRCLHRRAPDGSISSPRAWRARGWSAGCAPGQRTWAGFVAARAMASRPLIAPVAAGVAAFGAFYAAALISPPAPGAESRPSRPCCATPPGALTRWCCVTSLANGVAEEVFFRGALVRCGRRATRRPGVNRGLHACHSGHSQPRAGPRFGSDGSALRDPTSGIRRYSGSDSDPSDVVEPDAALSPAAVSRLSSARPARGPPAADASPLSPFREQGSRGRLPHGASPHRLYRHPELLGPPSQRTLDRSTIGTGSWAPASVPW